MLDLLQLVEQHAHAVARHGTEEVAIGPFTALFSPDAALSHAYPTRPVAVEDLAAPLADLRRAFEGRNQHARIEFAAMLWPNLPGGLERHGFALESGAAIWCATPASLKPQRDPMLTVRWIGERDDFAFLAALIRQGFEIHDGPATAEDAAALRDGLAAGVRWAVAKREGAPVGSGCSTPIGDTTEISAVSVLPTQRGRGAASAILTFLAEQHFAGGGQLAWTSPADPAAQGLLVRNGFADTGLRMTYVAA